MWHFRMKNLLPVKTVVQAGTYLKQDRNILTPSTTDLVLEIPFYSSASTSTLGINILIPFDFGKIFTRL